MGNLIIKIKPEKGNFSIEEEIRVAVRYAKYLRIEGMVFSRDDIDIDLKKGSISEGEVYKTYLKKRKEKLDAAYGKTEKGS